MSQVVVVHSSDDDERGDRTQPEWDCVMQELENIRHWLLAQFAPQDPEQYLQVDQACRLLTEVLLAQDHRRWTKYTN